MRRDKLEWINETQNRNKWRDVVIMVIKVCGEIFEYTRTNRLLHGVNSFLLALVLLISLPILLINLFFFCFLHLPWRFFLLSPPASSTKKNWASRRVFPDSEVSVISLFTAVSCLLRAFVYVILRILPYCSLLRGAQYEIYIKKAGKCNMSDNITFSVMGGKKF